jgi:hypothetical protein
MPHTILYVKLSDCPRPIGLGQFDNFTYRTVFGIYPLLISHCLGSENVKNHNSEKTNVVGL